LNGLSHIVVNQGVAVAGDIIPAQTPHGAGAEHIVFPEGAGAVILSLFIYVFHLSFFHIVDPYSSNSHQAFCSFENLYFQKNSPG
jgi:hypothetical protein